MNVIELQFIKTDNDRSGRRVVCQLSMNGEKKKEKRQLRNIAQISNSWRYVQERNDIYYYTILLYWSRYVPKWTCIEVVAIVQKLTFLSDT